jgi:hypothetical protein
MPVSPFSLQEEGGMGVDYLLDAGIHQHDGSVAHALQ